MGFGNANDSHLEVSMKKKTWRKMIRSIVRSYANSGAKRERSFTKSGPGRMPYSRKQVGRQRLAPAHGPGSLMELG